MIVQLRKPESLSQPELDVWNKLIASSAEFRSPYFHPQFVMDVAAVRNDVEVAVISNEGAAIGFFPFQRSGKTARPVGGMLSDAHGVIIKQGFDLDLPTLLSQCGLAAWEYHYQIASQIPEANWQPEIEQAAVMNLEGGFDEYAKRLESKSVVKQTERKARKLERECGEIRFEWDSRDENAFDLMRKWKSEQYKDSNIANVFAFDWTVELLRKTWDRNDSGFQGLLSVMYVDNKPAAVHFGLRAGGVLHQWFPAYDPALFNYSPGVIHLLDMARYGAANGVHRIDLGRICPYKARVATHTVDVAAGSVDLRAIARLLKNGYQQTYEWLRHSPLRTVALIPGRMLRRLAEQRQFQ